MALLKPAILQVILELVSTQPQESIARSFERAEKVRGVKQVQESRLINVEEATVRVSKIAEPKIEEQLLARDRQPTHTPWIAALNNSLRNPRKAKEPQDERPKAELEDGRTNEAERQTREQAKQLAEKAKLSDRDDIGVDEEGKIVFNTGGSRIDNEILIELVKCLATELANARAELWLLQIDKGE
jgi:hypothetical protein